MQIINTDIDNVLFPYLTRNLEFELRDSGNEESIKELIDLCKENNYAYLYDALVLNKRKQNKGIRFLKEKYEREIQEKTDYIKKHPQKFTKHNLQNIEETALFYTSIQKFVRSPEFKTGKMSPVATALNEIKFEQPYLKILGLTSRGTSGTDKNKTHIRAITETWAVNEKIGIDEIYFIHRDKKHKILAEIGERYTNPEFLFIIDDDPRVTAQFLARGITCIQPEFITAELEDIRKKQKSQYNGQLILTKSPEETANAILDEYYKSR